MSTVRLSHSLRLDRMVRYCLLASLVLALLAGLPAAQVYARPLLAMTYTQTVELTSNIAQANAAIGSPIAISGNTVVLGAPSYSNGKGAVYVFTRSMDTGVWDTAGMATLTKPGGANADQFGYAVAIEGNTIVVGAPNDDSVAKDGGAVYVFSRSSGNTWSLVQGGPAFYAGQTQSDKFGSSVAISGSTIAVGAPYEDTSKRTKNAGTVLLFKLVGDNAWGFSAEIARPFSSSNKDRGDLTGSTLAVEGDTLLVGSPKANGDTTSCQGNAGCGMVTVYSRSKSDANQWNELAVIQASPLVQGQYFGKSVAISGSRIVVGAPYAVNNTSVAGRVYIYNLSGSIATQVATITGTALGDQFGASVAIDGNRLAVGQPNVTTDQGAVRMYEDALLSGTWLPMPQPLTLTSPVSGDQLGAAVVMSGQTVFAGAPGRTPASGTNDQGAAYIFSYINPDGTPTDGTANPPELDLDSTLNGTGFLSTFTVPVAPAALRPAEVVNKSTLTITDVDSTELTSATVTLTNIRDAGKETLSATESGNVQASYDAATGVLALTPKSGSTASLSDFVAVLKTVVYSNTSWLPDTTPRLIEFQVSDGTNTSNMAVATVFVARSKQNPVLTFVLNGQSPYHINQTYTVDFSVARPASVGAEVGVPSGTVIILMSNGATCQGVLDAAGNGSCSLKMTSVGSFDMTAAYASSNSNFNDKTATLSLTVSYTKLYMPFLRK